MLAKRWMHRVKVITRRTLTTVRLVPIAIAAVALAGCGGGSSGQGSADPPSAGPPSSNPTPPPPSPLSIATTSLPSGTVGNAYAVTLAAAGGTPPYEWSLTGGTLPSGLSLNAASGEISGKPAAVAAHSSLTFRVTDSGGTARTASATLSLTISARTIAITVSPRQAGLTVGQKLQLTARTSDSTGVAWSISPAAGQFSSATSPSGTTVTLTAPQTAGVYTISAGSVTDPTQSASMQIGVTDLAGVYTYHNDLSRDGANRQEYALTPGNVNSSSFGKIFSCTVDGAIYAQPLWIAGLQVSGAVHNVVLVATAHDSLYAFDADAAPCIQLWQVSLVDTSHGGTGGETTVPAGPSGNLVGVGDGDMTPEVGVTGTPVIDPTTDTVYVVSKSMNAAGTSFFQRLHAIDLASGAEKPGSPVAIAGTFPGTGDSGSTVSFNARMENQRAGLALVNGTVYVAWGSHEDAQPFYGWMMSYQHDGSAFSQNSVFNTAPNAREGGIWMSGAAPAADSQGRLYALTGNAAFDATSATAPNDDYGDSLLELSLGLSVMQYFTPSNQHADQIYNNDFGSGGAAVLADLPAGSPVTHLVIAGGKDGNLYVFNRDALGGYGDTNAWQELSVGTEGDLNADTPGVIFTVGAMWNDNYYVAGAAGPLQAFRLDPSTAKLSLAGTAIAPAGGFGYPGSTPSISAAGNTNGVIWVLDDSQYCTKASPGCGAAVLYAYDAYDVTKELWSSGSSSADRAGNAVKFTLPTIANGKVYIGTRGNNTGGAYGSTSAAGELDVYGLKP